MSGKLGEELGDGIDEISLSLGRGVIVLTVIVARHSSTATTELWQTGDTILPLRRIKYMTWEQNVMRGAFNMMNCIIRPILLL
jgi:hypothetical protein